MKRQGGQSRTRRAARARRGFDALLLLTCVAASVVWVAAQTAARQGEPKKPAAEQTAARTRYRIELKLDFDARSFDGTERVRWVNRDSRATSVLYFHLYANHRPQTEEGGRAQATAAAGGANGAAQADAPDEPRVEVTQVRSAATEQPLAFSLDEQGVTLRVQLREPVPPGGAAELFIAFKGRVPEIDADETSLSAHVVQQVGAALRDTREWRRARDTNFTSRGVMLLGAFHPVLAARTGDDWQRRVESGVGRFFHTEAADYEVSIETPSDVTLFASGQATTAQGAQAGGDRAANTRVFAGESLRGFAFVAGRSLRVAEQVSAGVRVRSVYAAEHERVGRRVLGVAAEAVRVFASRFGAPPYRSFTVAEAPLVAGLGNVEFSGLGVVASAFYVDFDAPSTRNLPPLVREQRASVEDSLEFTVAHLAAHQWWGGAVGNDPERAPVLDEALAHWSALLYYQDAYGAERAAQASDDQLKGVYQVYRSFGGEDLGAGGPARQYRNSFQYAAIVSGKGALMFKALRGQMGEGRFWPALRKYYEANRFEVAETRDLQAAFVAEVPVAERRALARTFDRWLSEKRGDEDIAPPNPELAAAFGISVEQRNPKDGNSIVRLGRFFWRQMTRIR